MEEPIFSDNGFSLIESAEWVDVEDFCEALDDNSNNYALRYLYHAVNSEELCPYLRLKSSAGFITGDMGCEFTEAEAINMDIELYQCLPLDKELFLTMLQGYEFGEFETGIFSEGYLHGGYTSILKSLEGTAFEGLF